MPDTSAVRTLARRAKTAALTKAVDVLENPANYSPDLYNQTYLTVLKNAVPRTQELTGEDGEPIKVELSASDKKKLLSFLEPDVNQESPKQSNNGQASGEALPV